MKHQNQQILSWIQCQQSPSAPSAVPCSLPANVPINFPISTFNDFNIFEEYLRETTNLEAVCDYLSTVGGKDATTTTNRILKRCISNSLATKFSFFGKRQNKRAINDTLFKDLVIRAVKKSQLTATEQDVENILKAWLKHAPQRVKLESK
ncbi:hypothetical protein PPYR_04496 [Photinus pyralis]|uniref:DUF4806 domain-containing protein n=1 Tax=Photinus pyralis TaxID=7054 RepID=A0A5N4AYS3_PHOPY|nr:uncharacterized protein LOC116165143 [Photinus pyralis]KAB0802310.1 hypothetical protein PPYR_04496 [Photinus pyralis]